MPKVSTDQALDTLDNAIKMIQAVKAAIEQAAISPDPKATGSIDDPNKKIIVTGGLRVGGKGGTGCEPC